MDKDLFVWSYTIDYYDDFDASTTVCRGFVVASSNIDALQKLVDTYGDKSIENIRHFEAFDICYGTGVIERANIKDLNWDDDIMIDEVKF